MKQVLLFFAVAVLVTSCGGESRKLVKQAEPLIKEKVLNYISHPETYEAISTEYLGRGLVDKSSYIYYEEGPTGDSIVVRVFSHTYTHHSRSHDIVNGERCLFLTDDMKAVLMMRGGKEPAAGEIRWIR